MKNCLHPCITVFLLTFATQQNAWAHTASAPATQTETQQDDRVTSEAKQLKQTLKNTFQNIKDAISGKKDEDDSKPQVLTPKYPVEIDVDNAEIKAMLEEFLPILVYQRKEVLDREQVEFLAEDTPKSAQEMIRTEGYFNAQVTVSPKGEGYVVKVVLGKRTQIDNVSVALLGDIVSDDDLSLYYKKSFEHWALPVGAPFRQEDWTTSKASVLSAVTRKKYPLAMLSHTQATVNPDTKKADLTVNVDSKNPIYFGETQISGNERYPVSVIQGLAQYKEGDVYDLDKILDYQQALEQDAHYSGASVQADFDKLQGDRVPVIVSVSEVKRQKVEAGVRFDSEYGLGANIGYDHYNLFNRGYVGSVYADWDKYQTTLAFGISQPRKANGHYWTSNIAYTRSTTQKLETKAVTSGLWYVRDSDNIEARYGVEFIGEDTRLPDQNINLGRSFATMLTASWKRQQIETPLRPANGYYFDGKIGTTLGKLLSSAMMARVKGRAGYYFTPENKQIGTFIARSELGYVYTNKDTLGGDVPSSLMFRTGGANSIRGYELDSIGRRVFDSDTVFPERAMAVFSAEYQYLIKKDFALAVFHDLGGAAPNFKDMTLRHGTGLGVRWFSPVAPFSFDIAYGHHDRKVRWHISLGTRF
ncbi:autotransporter assembly complex protein TamA [Neisseriaceae bacterium B1]